MKSRLFITVLLALFTVGLSTGASAVSWTMVKITGSTTGTNPSSVAVADFNGDGIPDVAVVDKVTDGQITILLGKPGGHFAAPRTILDGDKPVSIVAADFNEDGNMDLAVAEWGSNEVRIYLGDGHGKFTLAAHPTIPVGLNPVHLRAADLGNGHQDLVVACYGSGKVHVLLGNGDGTFTQAAGSPYTVGTNPRHVCIADFNHDGLPDIAVTLWGENNVAVMLNNGGGIFDTSPASTTFKKYATSANPLAVEAADLNGDGNIDLAVGEFLNNGIRILDGDGTGNFSLAPTGQAARLPSGSPQEIVLKDFDGDGNIDIAVADSSSDLISVFLGRGNGTFRAVRRFPAGTYPAALGSADFDRKGLPDLVSANFSASHVTLLRSHATSFGFWSYTSIPSVSLTAGTNPSALLADDFDYDGVMDIAVANKGSNNVSVLLNRKYTFGNMSGKFGNFTSAVTTPAPGAPASFASLSTISAPSGIASGAFSNVSSASNPVPDKRAGLAVANSGNGTVAILLPGGGGTFVLPGSGASPQRLTAGSHPSAIKTAEFSQDKKTDVAVCNQDDGTITVFLGNGNGTFGDGKGTAFQTGTTYKVGDGPVSMALGDINKDGFMDIAVANSGKGSDGSAIGSGNGSVSILFGKGNGTFGKAQTMLAGKINPTSIAAATGGGLVITETDGMATVLQNNGSGVFSKGSSFTVGTSPAGVLAEDVTNDGRSDLVTANSGSDSITLIPRNASLVLETPVDFPAGASPVALAAHDFSGDGATDLAVADSGGGVTVLFGRDIATLTVNITGSGTVSVQSKAEGTQTATADSVFQEEGGKELVLTATAAAGYRFVSWDGDLTGSKNPAYLEMKPKTRKVSAEFQAAP